MSRNIKNYNDTRIEPFVSWAIELTPSWEAGPKIITYRTPIKAAASIEGSQRWWVIKRNRFDFDFIKRYGAPGEPISITDKGSNRYTLTRRSLESHEKEWEDIVREWYIKRDEMKIDDVMSICKFSDHPASRYLVQKASASEKGDRLLSIEEACKVPPFVKEVRGGDGSIIGLHPNVKKDVLGMGGCKALTEGWWLAERARYDYGDIYHPVASSYGMVSGDWTGIERKSKEREYDSWKELMDDHQRGWIQWVRAVYGKWIGDSQIKSNFDVVKKNLSIWKKLSTADALSIIASSPRWAFGYLPETLYCDFICKALKKITDFGIVNYKYLSDVKKGMHTISKTRGIPCSKSKWAGFPSSGVDIIVSIIPPDELFAYALSALSYIYLIFPSYRGFVLASASEKDFIYSNHDKKLLSNEIVDLDVRSVYGEDGCITKLIESYDADDARIRSRWGFE